MVKIIKKHLQLLAINVIILLSVKSILKKIIIVGGLMSNSLEFKKINKLILSVANGDKMALSNLFELQASKLKHFANVFLYNKSNADDVVSEVFIKIASNANTFNSQFNGINWLLEITKNTALNINRSEHKYKCIPIEYEDNYKGEDFPWDRLIVGEMFDKLDKLEKKIIYLYYWEGRSLREIALSTDLTKSSLHRKIKKIIKSMS